MLTSNCLGSSADPHDNKFVLFPAPARSWVEISRSQIASNYAAICELAGPGIEVMPVVKADAYRHGAVEVSRVLTSVGARSLAVSNVEEGVALRDAGIEARILVMADFLPYGRGCFFDYRLTPVLHSLEDIAILHRMAGERRQVMKFHLKIDSGMGRLGTRASAVEIARTLRKHPSVCIEGLMTHFASVSDYASGQTDEQLVYYQRLVSQLSTLGVRPAEIHLSSTGGIAYRQHPAWGNLLRPGQAIYGYVSPSRGAAPDRALQVSPVMSWKAAVLAVKSIPEGATVGYGAIFRAPKPMRIAILAVGYADGLPHRLGNRGRVIACGRFASILGAVSMDVTTIDATESPALEVGSPVTILGSEGNARIDAQDIAKTAGTISYNVLCGISSRVRRIYD